MNTTSTSRADVEHDCKCYLAHFKDSDMPLALNLLAWFYMLSDQGKNQAVEGLENLVFAEYQAERGKQA